jgi:hypothetical protein
MLVLSRTPLLERFRASISNKAKTAGKAKTWIMAISLGGLILGYGWSVYVGEVLFRAGIILSCVSLISRLRFVRDGR